MKASLALCRLSGSALLETVSAGDTLALVAELRDRFANTIIDVDILRQCDVRLDLSSSQSKTSLAAQLGGYGSTR